MGSLEINSERKFALHAHRLLMQRLAEQARNYEAVSMLTTQPLSPTQLSSLPCATGGYSTCNPNA
jgi:hypothetical protein